jgi:hypothetical protein
MDTSLTDNEEHAAHIDVEEAKENEKSPSSSEEGSLKVSDSPVQSQLEESMMTGAIETGTDANQMTE